METFSNPKLQGNIFELQKNKTNESPFCIMLAFMKILSPPPPRALCQGHVYLVLRFQSLFFFFRFNFLQHNQLTPRWPPLLQCKNASRYQGIFNWDNLKKKNSSRILSLWAVQSQNTFAMSKMFMVWFRQGQKRPFFCGNKGDGCGGGRWWCCGVHFSLITTTHCAGSGFARKTFALLLLCLLAPCTLILDVD